jgi:hypothetical protein
LLWLGLVFIASFIRAVFGRDGRGVLAGMIAGFLLMAVKGLLTQRRLRPRPGGALLCRYDVQLTQHGVHVQTPHWTNTLLWPGILAVEETPSHCFLRIDRAGAYTVPKRSFANDEAARQFVAFARDCAARAQITGATRT